MKIIPVFMAGALLAFQIPAASAQNVSDLLRFSQNQTMGTARSQGMGNAFGAVGADYSALQINPAGLGLYRRNEAHLSMGINADISNANYFGTSASDSRTGFHIPSMGFVVSKVYNDMGQDRVSGLVSINFAAGLNRVGSFQQNFTINGINTNSSVLDYLVEQANGTDVSQYRNSNVNDPLNNYRNDLGAQAWTTYLIDTMPNSTNSYTSRLANAANYNLRQSIQGSMRGAIYEYNVSAGANISNMIYVGASLVFTNIRYEKTESFDEQVVAADHINFYKGARITSDISAAGSGVSGRFGVIVKPVDFFRFGVSAQTPARINIRDEFRYTTTGFFTNTTNTYDPQSKDFVEYQVLTPARYTGSMAFVFSSFGLISADVEMVNYASAQFKSNNIDYSNTNQAARNNLQQSMNYRIGAEFKFDDASGNLADSYRLRAGWGLIGSPYKIAVFNVNETNLQRQLYSGGFGMVFDRMFVDFAISALTGTDYIQPYTLQGKAAPVGENRFTAYNFALTTGIRF